MRFAREGLWHKVRGEGRRRETKWDIAREGKRMDKQKASSSSFFVTEFGDRWKARDLFFEFKNLGEIEEVVIPPRKDKFGRRFGFVCFLNVKDEELLATKLDNIVLDDRKIFANLPRFSRSNLAKTSGVEAKTRAPTQTPLKGYGGDRFGGNKYGKFDKNRSYAKVTQNIRGCSNDTGDNLMKKIVSFQPGYDVLSQYKNAYTGWIKEAGKMADLKSLFLEEGIFTIRITRLGPNLCILEDLVEGEVELFMEEKKSWWEQWFSKLKRWEPEDIDKERVAWIRVMGVPCHAWCEKCFCLLVDSIGVFMKCEEGTLLKNRMDVANICIRTKIQDRVDVVVRLSIEGQFFDVRMMEDIHGFSERPKYRAFGEEAESEEFSQSEDGKYDGEEAVDVLLEEVDEAQHVDVDGTNPTNRISLLASSFDSKCRNLSKKVSFGVSDSGNVEWPEAEREQAFNVSGSEGNISEVGE
ncbi:uncharacterized protein LOC131604256 [Vicia villosa]|uniref:uncharacterized protein LOC131604256 n=1 Tax=Vicia villosa TaxID=3911 RepID=UPI00273B8FF9|nr:uncharacterized protein LOC131604256 [Vicia villosa]